MVNKVVYNNGDLTAHDVLRYVTKSDLLKELSLAKKALRQRNGTLL